MEEKQLCDRSKTAYLSYLNVISAVAVVILHSNDAFWAFRPDDLAGWNGNNIVECIFYFAVPIFFMLTGATLIDYPLRYDTKTFYTKRIKKTVIPYLFWICIPFILSIVLPSIYHVDTTLSPSNFFNGIVNYQWFNYYWFFIPLFCIYLSMPLFAFVQQEKKIKVFSFIAIVAFIINAVIPFAIDCINRFRGSKLEWKYSISVAAGYLLFVMLGYLFHKLEIPLKLRLVIYFFALAGLLTHIIGTYCVSVEAGKIDQFFKGYENLPCILYASGIFVFVKYAVKRIKSQKRHQVVFRLQEYTLAIYLIHRILLPVVVRLLGVTLPGLPRLSLGYTFVMAAILIPLCFLITFILRKIPIVRNIVPK